jgi:hypothetical protein
MHTCALEAQKVLEGFQTLHNVSSKNGGAREENPFFTFYTVSTDI